MTYKLLITTIKDFIKSEKAFLKNVSVVFSSKVYVAILSLLLTPIIARLFTPEDYGEYGLFNTIVQNLVVVGTLSLPLALATSKKEELNKIFHLTSSLILAFTILFGIALFLLHDHLDALFTTSIFSKFWGIVLLGFVLTALITTLNAVNVRLQHFKTITKVGVVEASSVKALNLATGFIKLNSLGLMLSDVISKTVSLFLLLKTIPRGVHFSFVKLDKIKSQLKTFKQFPLFVMPSQWVGMLNNQFLILVVALLFSKNELGQLVMAIGLVGIPLHVITNAFQPVITERLSSLKGSVEIKPFFKRTAILLFIISSILFTTILVLPSDIFTIILGAKWDGIKPMINVIAVYYIILLIDQSLENGFIVFNQQKPLFFWSLVELVLQTLIITYGYLQELPLLVIITSIVTARILVSFIRVFYLWGKLKSTIIEL